MTTYEDLSTPFPSISEPFAPKLSILRVFLVLTCILLSFVLFLLSPFVPLGFYTLGYIYPCTLICSSII